MHRQEGFISLSYPSLKKNKKHQNFKALFYLHARLKEKVLKGENTALITEYY